MAPEINEHLEQECNLFADIFSQFVRNGLYKAQLPKDGGVKEIEAFLDRVLGLRGHIYGAFVDEGTDVKKLPFLSIVEDAKGSFKLVIEIIACAPGEHIEKAIITMERMVYMFGLLKKRRGDCQNIKEFLKFLYLYIEWQTAANEEDVEPLQYDAEAAGQLIDVLDIELGEGLKSGLEQEAERTEVFDMERKLRDALYRYSKSNNETVDVQSTINGAAKRTVNDD